MNWLNNLGVGIKLNLLLLVVLGVFLVTTISLVTFNTENLTQEIGSERINEEVSILTNRLAELEAALTVDVNFLASNVTFFQAVGRRNVEDTTEIVSAANELLKLDDIDVIDGDGERLVDLDVDDSSSEEDSLLRRALSGSQVNAILIETHDDDTEISIAATAPVVSITGNVLGAIQISRLLDNDFLHDLTFERQKVYVGLIYEQQILNRNISTGTQVDHLLRSNLAFDPNAVVLAMSGEQVIGDELVISNGVPHAVAYIPLVVANTSSPVALMLAVELDEIVAFQNRTLLNTILVFVVLTLVTLMVLYFVLFRVVIRPIDRLRTIARQMTSGQYDQRIPVVTRDELGQLALTFNDMANAVQQREISLQAAREQAEQADHVKTAFLASMSHELRTPLNAVINFTRFILDGDTGEINEEQNELLTEVFNSATHLLNLINDVLDMSKIEAGSLTLFIEDDVDVHEIVQTTLSTGRGLLGGKSVQLESQVDTALPLIAGDRQRILQILLNIMSNACKFTQKGEIKLTAAQQNNEIIISIADTGPGIVLEDQALVFEAFKQTHTGLQQGGGTGLGMPIAKSLCEAHGGRLWMKSVPGQGTTFYVALPVQSHLVPTLAS